ncbi:MAG: acetylesterase [Lachnospiraceae bacterium]|jgi:putative tributyrin esterase|nr:acetylesterase [Lachnospiraceae bacterium]
MAILKMELYAKTMRRTVTAAAVLPAESLKRGQRCACLYLLHGVQGSYINWLTATNLFRLLGQYNAAHEKKLAIVLPSGGNGFYHPAAGRKEDYERFVGEELIELTRAMLPLSSSREDTWIAGLSMGGYGALRTGLLYPEVFGFAGGLSSALLTQDMEGHCREDGAFFERPEFLQEIFGDLQAAADSVHDVRTLSHLAERLPKLYLACGKQDGLLDLTRGLHEDWQRSGIEHVYEEHDGGHDWAFWEWGLQRILKLRGE